VLLLELTGGTAEITVVGGDDKVVNEVETEDGDEDNLSKDPAVLTAVGPEEDPPPTPPVKGGERLARCWATFFNIRCRHFHYYRFINYS
jgi:hypothetical protein